jgi:hypothetical protein
MKVLLILTLLISYSAFAQNVDCAADPFAEGCSGLNSNAIDTATEIVCNNGHKVKADGRILDKDGAEVTTIAAIGAASGAVSACDSYGGMAAYAKQDNDLKVTQNLNNVGSAQIVAGASAGSAAAAASVAAGSGDTIIGGGVIGGSTGAACTSECDCPNGYDACVGGFCENVQNQCGKGFSGFVKGDATCKWQCNGVNWSCPAGGQVCGGGKSPPSCTKTCDCAGSYEACVSGVCENVQNQCGSGFSGLVRGDANCQWQCSGGNWNCPAGGQVCGGK